MKPDAIWHTQVKFWFKADWIDASLSKLASPSRLDAFIDKVETVLDIKGTNTAGLLRLLSQDDLQGSPWSTLATMQPDRVSEPTYLTRETFDSPVLDGKIENSSRESAQISKRAGIRLQLSSLNTRTESRFSFDRAILLALPSRKASVLSSRGPLYEDGER